ncbi:MAG: NPCBM/NEW2 domain-containing protein [Planctomycetota bacterium]|nr:NPCBM/NEW2 domain-containing protein [Planctomycetota bacterium]
MSARRATAHGKEVHKLAVCGYGVARVFFLSVFLFLLLPFAAAEDAPKPPPPAIEVSADWDASYTRVESGYSGNEYLPEENNVRGVKRTEKAVLFPGRGQEIGAVLKIKANEKKRRVSLSAKVSDYNDLVILEVKETLDIEPEKELEFSVRFTPPADSIGPYSLESEWQDADGKLNGEFHLAAGQAGSRMVLEDFEMARYPKAGQPLESSVNARHDGERGLLVRVEADKDPVKPVTMKLPLNKELPGHPVAVRAWFMTDKPVQLKAVISDPGFPALQRLFPDQWTLGPIEIAVGDWQMIEIPMPGFGRSSSTKQQYGEGNGVVDYPLTLDWLEFAAAGGATVFIDQLEVLTQTVDTQTVSVRPVLIRPGGLLYRNDVLKLALANTSLVGQPVQLQLTASLRDIHGKSWPLLEQKSRILPGEETILLAKLTNLPLGAYELEGKVVSVKGEVSLPSERFVVYEPGGRPLDESALFDFLTNRERLLADLGFGEELMMLPWHSVDGSLSVEPVAGYWTFDWFDPELNKRVDAGLGVVGMLGFTPIWADPSASFNRGMQAWYGNVYVKPSHKIYWEEYVRRTAERFGDRIQTWVVWDRPDSPAFKATPQEFAEDMLAVAHEAISRANPKAKLVSGGVTRGNIDKFLIGLAEARAQTYLDGIGILPSTTPLSPEEGYLDVILARAERIRQAERISTPLWVLNLGWPSGPEDHQVSEADQARFVARAYVICRSQGIKNIFFRPDHTEAIARRDSADLIFQEDNFYGVKPAALTIKPLRSLLFDAEPVREVFLNDQWDRLSRAYLFKKADGRLVLAAWRLEGESNLPLAVRPENIIDLFGNPISAGQDKLQIPLDAQLRLLLYPRMDSEALLKSLERTNLEFKDAPESQWKRSFTFHLDVGNSEDEKAAAYVATDSRIVGPVASNYHNPQGRFVVDSGRHIRGEEKFSVEVAGYGDADMILRKRLNYSVPHQRVKVYCDGELAGQWFAFKMDRRYRWRDAEYIVPNRFLHGKQKVELRFVTQGDAEATSYYYWAGPLSKKTVYVSDLSHMVSSSVYGGMMSRDRSILGTPMKFFQQPEEVYEKGIGSHGAATLTDSLLVMSLNKQFKRFRATVGLDASTNGKGSVRFRVRDGKKTIFDSEGMTYFSEPKEIDVDVSDAILLMLWVSDNGDGRDNDIANWANARLEVK